MTFHRSLFVASLAATAALSMAPVSSVHAASQLGGSPVPGVCMLSREAVFAQAKVGKAASERLNQLAQQARTRLVSERKPLEADIQTFQQGAAKLSEAQRQQQGAALQQRMQGLQGEAGALNDRIQLTRAKVMQRISVEAEPIIATAYQGHRCGLLLNRDAVMGGNTTNDLTTEVVQGLDRKITTMSFDLEPLPTAANSGK